MQKVLITGATGNVSTELIRRLTGKGLILLAGVRNPREQHPLFELPDVEPVAFDFSNPATFPPALEGVATMFLLRPPQLADVPRYFAPLVQAAVRAGVGHIVFLSVQGAGSNRFIPHHKIEDLVLASGIPYTFLRPAYFMQNFTTTLLSEIREYGRIFLPAGRAKFTLVDVRDVGAAGAAIILNPSAHSNKAYDLTSHDQLDFGSMAYILSQASGKKISFADPGLLSFLWQQRRKGVPFTYIGVLVMLHYLPRFQKAPATSNAIEDITGKQPVDFEAFAKEYASLFR